MEYDYDDPELALAAPYLTAQAQTQVLRRPPPPSEGKTRLTGIPTQGPQKQPEQDYQQPAPAAARPDYRSMALSNLQQAANQDATEEDRRAMIEYARQRHEGAGGDIAVGMFLSQMGGRALAPVGQMVLRNALAAREPLKVEGGYVTPDRFVADPQHAARSRSTRLETQARIFEAMAANADTLEQRRVAMEQANEVKREALELRRTIAANRPAAQEPLVPVYDPQTQTTTYQPRSQARGAQVPPRAGAGGRQLPPSAANQISEDEGKVAQFSNLVGTWKPDYGGWGTSVGNVVGNYSPISSEAQREQAQWWRGYQAFVNEMRHAQFGAALTPTEKAEFTKAIITPETDPRIVNTFLQTQLKLAETARQRRVANLGRAGYDVSNFGGAPGGNQQQPAPPGAPGPRNAPGVTNFAPTGAGVVDFSSLK